MSEPRRLLLTFRLDVDQRQRLKARLAAEGRTMSEVITSGLRQYVQRPGGDTADTSVPLASLALSASPVPLDPLDMLASPEPPGPPAAPALPAETAARLRELRASGRSGVLSATLSALHADGWPLPTLAEALGVSRQAIQARIRQRVPAELRDRAADCAPPPPFPRRREPSKGRLRPHLTIKIDHALRSAAHLAAAREGHSLSQVVETILERYLRHGLADAPDKPRRAARRSR
jgi:antitoxin component of RelBE/YafQ-DinJ toxin-antitoxin module